MAVVVQLKDFGLQDPGQVLRVFFRTFDSPAIEFRLWKVFAVIVHVCDDVSSDNRISLDEIAIVFDELIALTKAVEKLIDDPPKRCPFCKRVDIAGESSA